MARQTIVAATTYNSVQARCLILGGLMVYQMITSLLLPARKNIAIEFKVEICVTLLQYF